MVSGEKDTGGEKGRILLMQEISEHEVLQPWALSEALNKERWGELVKLLPLALQIKLGEYPNISLQEEDNKILENALLTFRKRDMVPLQEQHFIWHMGTIPFDGLEQMKIMDWYRFTEISHSRNLADLAAAVERGNFHSEDKPFADNVLRLVNNFDYKKTLGNLVAVSETESPPYRLLEGYSRACAMLILKKRGDFHEVNLPIILGVSPRLNEWELMALPQTTSSE